MEFTTFSLLVAVGYFIFKERYTKLQYLGIFFGLVSVLLLTV